MTANRTALAWLFAIVAAGAQSPEPLIRSDVRQVLVPFVVTDQHGHHVSDLKASDFQVLEDGRPQRIVAFTTSMGAREPEPLPIPDAPAGVRSTSPANPKTAAAPEVPSRSYLIVVDTLHSSFANFGRVRNALAAFLAAEHTVDSQYALIALGREATVVQDSTRDTAAIMNAVRSSKFLRMIQDSEAANVATTADRFPPLVAAYCGACGCNGRGAAICVAQPKIAVQQFLTAFSERTMLLDREFLRQLKEIVRATADMPISSRTIVFLSDGFNRFAGRELDGILQGYGARDSSFLFNPRDMQPELDAVLKLATKSDVKFYTIDSRGLYAEGSLPGSNFSATSSTRMPAAVDSMIRSVGRENTDALAELAHQTGGIFFENNNDLLKGIRQAFADGREYYVIAYVPENKATDGRYRKIVVTARDRNWRVNAKAGYWATAN
jgi:VWFA-related protein